MTIIILAILAGFMHGYKEGMIMHSLWVQSYPDQVLYHLIAPVMYGLIGILGIFIDREWSWQRDDT